MKLGRHEGCNLTNTGLFFGLSPSSGQKVEARRARYVAYFAPQQFVRDCGVGPHLLKGCI